MSSACPLASGARFVLDRPRTGAGRTASSHGFGVDDAVSVAAAPDRMPGRLIVHAIEAADMTQGLGLMPLVAAAVGTVARLRMRWDP
jgi:hydrogenase maturation protease